MVFWDGELQCENLVPFKFVFGWFWRLVCVFLLVVCFSYFGLSAFLLVCAETLYVCLISAYYWPSGLADRNALEVTSTCPACLLVPFLPVCLSYSCTCTMQSHAISLKIIETMQYHQIPLNTCWPMLDCLSVCLSHVQVCFCLCVPCPMYLSVCPMSAFVRSVQEPAGERRAAMPGSSTGMIGVTIAICPFANIDIDHQIGRRFVPAERRVGHNSDKR